MSTVWEITARFPRGRRIGRHFCHPHHITVLLKALRGWLRADLRGDDNRPDDSYCANGHVPIGRGPIRVVPDWIADPEIRVTSIAV